MKLAVLGTGIVGQAIASALIQKGHEVMMGSRTATNEKAIEWKENNGPKAHNGTFEEAAKFAELILLCINGDAVVDVLQSGGQHNFNSKVVIDLTNPLDFSNGFPPSLIPKYSNTWSLGEEVQKLLPGAKVVKALNTVTAALMIDARLVNDGNHHLFICGNDAEAKNKVKHFLHDNFYWKPEYILDLGSIKNARLTEGIIPFWVGVMQAEGSAIFNFMIVK